MAFSDTLLGRGTRLGEICLSGQTGAVAKLGVCRRKPSMAFSSWNLPKVNFGKFTESRQIVIWPDSGRAFRGPPGSLWGYFSNKLLEM